MDWLCLGGDEAWNGYGVSCCIGGSTSNSAGPAVLDLPALISIPVMLALFAFAIWYGITQCSVGIDAEEQARRQANTVKPGGKARTA